jgi:hypothetical protein
LFIKCKCSLGDGALSCAEYWTILSGFTFAQKTAILASLYANKINFTPREDVMTDSVYCIMFGPDAALRQIAAGLVLGV